MNASTSSLFLNIDSPFLYVDPGAATQMSILAYLTAGALAVFLWDLLSVVWHDSRVLRSVRGDVLYPTIYGISRLITLGYLILGAIFQTLPMGHCMEAHNILSSLYLIAASSTSFLALSRVRFLFSNDKFITSIFIFLWALVLGGCSTRIIGVAAENVGPTRYCTFSDPVKLYSSAFLIAPLLYLSTAFIFSAARLASRCRINFAAPNGLCHFIFADCISVILAGLFENGQGYYMLSIVLQLTSLIFFLSSSTAPGKLVLVDCSVAVMNILVCKVFIDDEAHKEDEEKSRKGQVMLSLGLRHHNAQVQGIQVTKTMENFI